MKDSKFNEILPIGESDNADKIIKNDKKLLTVALILGFVFTLIITLTTFIASIISGNVAAVFLTLFNAVISLVTLLVIINVAHNISRQTAVVIKIGEKLLDEKILPNSESAADSKLPSTAKSVKN